jgi:hypothetical protein
MTVQTAAPGPLDDYRRPRSELRVVGLFVLHFTLGFVAICVALIADLDAYGFGPSPGALNVAVGVAVVAWFAAGGLAFWLWATGRRFAFLASCAWFVAATGTVVGICATVPGPPCGSLWC